MNRKLTPRTRLENLRKEAKRWLGDLRRNEAKAQERLRRVCHDAPAQPGLRHVQYALAREYGVSNWAALKAAGEARLGLAPNSWRAADRTVGYPTIRRRGPL